MDRNKITTSVDGDGLIMTYEKSIYWFKCVSSESCFFEKDKNDLQIARQSHVLLKVPKSLLEFC